MPRLSTTLTVKVPVTPAVVAGKPATTNVSGTAGVTRTPASEPAIAGFAASDTDSDCDPTVLNSTRAVGAAGRRG